jgi:hypothetical protein
MLEGHSERICTFFEADYEPQIGFATNLSDAAEAVQAKFATPHWAFGTGGYLLRDPKKRLLLIWVQQLCLAPRMVSQVT